MNSTEDYLDSLLADAVVKSKNQSRTRTTGNSTKANSEDNSRRRSSFSSAESQLDSLLNGSKEDDYRQPLEMEAGGTIGLDDTLPEEYIPAQEPYINENNQELDEKLVLDSRIPDELLPVENVVEEEVSTKSPKVMEPEITESVVKEPEIPESKLSLDDIETGGFEEFNPSSKFESFLSEFGDDDEDDIEKRLAAAADVSDIKKIRNDDADVTDILEQMSENGDKSMDDIGDLLRASDNNKLVDTSLLDKLDRAEEKGELEEEDSEEDNSSKKKKKKNKKEKKVKNKNKDKDKDKENTEQGEKKPGLFSRLFGKKKKENTEDNTEEAVGAEHVEEASNSQQDTADVVRESAGTGSALNEPEKADDDFEKLLAETAEDAGNSLLDMPLAMMAEGITPPADKEPQSLQSGELDFFGPGGENDSEASGEGETTSEGGETEDSESEGSESEGSGSGSSESEGTPKKKGLLARILDLLTEEEEEPELQGVEGNLVSDENKAILDEIDAEDDGKGKGKKKKGKKEKAPKEKKEKVKKPKKPKKEKTPEPIDPKKIVPMKMKVIIFAFALSILAVLLLLMKFVPGMMNMSGARKSYYAKDYKDTFISMYGKDLSDSDKLLYEKAKVLVLIERKYESYENYMTMDMPIQALDALLQGLVKYEVVKDRASEYGVLSELNSIKDKILAALNLQFGVNETEALEIIGYEPIDYTLKLQSIIDGTPFEKIQDTINAGLGLDAGKVNMELESGNTELKDMLPEEKDLQK